MADSMRIRAQAADGKATVRVLMSHEMETGQRKDAAGNTIPAWYIQQVSARWNGAMVMNAQWGPAVAKNPTAVRREGRQGRRQDLDHLAGQQRRQADRRSGRLLTPCP
jgi:thiosulfate oxidation carrier complex protein SoxZ